MNKGALVIALTFIISKAQLYWGVGEVPPETVEMAADAIIGFIIAAQGLYLVFKRFRDAWNKRQGDAKVYSVKGVKVDAQSLGDHGPAV